MVALHSGLDLTNETPQRPRPTASTSPKKGKFFFLRYVEDDIFWVDLGSRNSHMVIVLTNPNGKGNVTACTVYPPLKDSMRSMLITTIQVTTKCHAKGLQFFPIAPNPCQAWLHQLRFKRNAQLMTKHRDISYMRGQPFELPAHMLVPMVGATEEAMEMEDDCVRFLQEHLHLNAMKTAERQ